jgi:hypothetical protein
MHFFLSDSHGTFVIYSRRYDTIGILLNHEKKSHLVDGSIFATS